MESHLLQMRGLKPIYIVYIGYLLLVDYQCYTL